MEDIKNGNGKKPWGKIRAITRDEIPPQRASTYWDLYLDLRDQLASLASEGVQEPAVETHFDEHSVAVSARASLRKIFDERNPTMVIEIRKEDNGATMFVYDSKSPSSKSTPAES